MWKLRPKMNKIVLISVPDFRESDFTKNLRFLHFSKLSHEIFRIDVESCEDLIYRAEFLKLAFKEIWRLNEG